MFVPNVLEPSSEALQKKVSFGAIFGGNYHKVPSNKVVALMWEARRFEK